MYWNAVVYKLPPGLPSTWKVGNGPAPQGQSRQCNSCGDLQRKAPQGVSDGWYTGMEVGGGPGRSTPNTNRVAMWQFICNAGHRKGLRQ